MKRSIKSLIGFTIGATDGDIGTVKDFYFEEDHSWTVRYLVVESGGWLNGRKVLISPDALLIPDCKNETFPTNLNREQIKNSPDIDTKLPVYRQQEIKLHEQYALENNWRGGFFAGGMPLPMNDAIMKKEDEISNKTTNDDLDLRSIEKVVGYHVKASDGTIGTIGDFLIDDANWNIYFIVVDTGNWLSGKSLMISTETVKDIKWDISEVILDISIARAKDCPEYDKGELWAL